MSTKKFFSYLFLFLITATLSCSQEDTSSMRDAQGFDDDPDSFNTSTYYNSTGALSLWVPPNQQTLRGIFFFHGAPVKNDPGGNNKRFANQELAQRQLAEIWGFALVRGEIWSEEIRGDRQAQIDFYLNALQEFAIKSGHPELSDLPGVFIGGSRFGGFSQVLAKEHPERVIAFVNFVISISNNEQSVAIPGVCMPGDQDSSSEAQINLMNKIFDARRDDNALWSIAMLWGVEHRCGHCMDYSFVFFDQVIKERLSANGSLKDCVESEGWLGQMNKYNTPKGERRDYWRNRVPEIASFNSYSMDKNSAAWLPNEYLAHSWRSFALYDNTIKAKITSPTVPTSRGKGLEGPSETRVGSMVNIEVSISDSSLGDIEIYDGNRKLGTVTKSSDGRSATLSSVAFNEPGLYALYVASGGVPVSRPAVLVVIP